MNKALWQRLPEAVLLDLDDTILADSSNVAECWRAACVSFHSQLQDVDPLTLYNAVERTRSWYWADPDRHRTGRLDLDAARREIVRMSLADLGFDAPALAESIAERYGSLRDLGVQPLPESMETLRWLRKKGCRLALLTNGSGPLQRRKIERFGLTALFEVILIEGELGYGKPDTRIYRRALHELHVAAAHTWMAGDNLEWDVAAPDGHGREFPFADREVSQTETFFLVTPHSDLLGPEAREVHRSEGITEVRWWSVAEIESTTELLFPVDLAERMRAHLKGAE